MFSTVFSMTILGIGLTLLDKIDNHEKMEEANKAFAAAEEATMKKGA